MKKRTPKFQWRHVRYARKPKHPVRYLQELLT